MIRRTFRSLALLVLFAVLVTAGGIKTILDELESEE